MESNLSKNESIYFGINFWPVIRLYIAFILIQKNQQPKVGASKGSKSSFSKIPFNPSEFKGGNQLFITHKNYVIEVEGKYYDRVLESFIRDSSSPIVLDLANNSLSFSGSEKSFKDISHQIYLIKILSYFMGTILSFFWIKKLKSLEKLQTSLSNSLFPVVDGRSIGIRICYIWLLSKYISNLLQRLKIDQIYQGMYYDNFGLATGLAAHKLGIINNCVQHGGQSANNPAFGSWKIAPKAGYELLPNNFLCWDKSSTNGIESWSEATIKHNTKVTGYGWMQLWKEDFSKMFNIDLNESIDSKYTVLITLQPSVNFKDSFLFKFLKHSDLKVDWMIRIHPRQESVTFLQSLEDDFKNYSNILIKSSKDPLPLLLIYSDLHITFFSSSVYEAKYCNVKSVIIDERGLDYFSDLIENGDIQLALDSKDLNEIIKSNNS